MPLTPSQSSKPKTHYTIEIDSTQQKRLQEWCDEKLWEPFSVDYACFAYRNKRFKTTLVAYQSGKLVVSGKGTEEFISHVLEPEITGNARLGYEEVHHPEWFDPHAGLDEAGKGDLFGPVVCATVIAEGQHVRQWLKDGITDSKKINDKRILELEKISRATPGVAVEAAWCGMPKYNELMAKPNANLNHLIAWLHARALDKALEKKPVSWGLLDQFSKQPLVQRRIKTANFDLQMRTRAESDPIVAAASIIARGTFIREMEKLGERYGEPLRKGASAQVKAQAKQLITKLGPQELPNYAKMHFKTATEALKGL